MYKHTIIMYNQNKKGQNNAKNDKNAKNDNSNKRLKIHICINNV